MKCRKNGFSLIELMIVVSIIAILALIGIPNYQNMRNKAFSSAAQSAGHNGALAQEMYKNERAVHAPYANDLTDLLPYNENLTDDSEVTFVFAAANRSGYTFTTQHAAGTESFVWKQ